MSLPPKDRKPPAAEWPVKTPAPAKPPEKGKVVHDDRGNAKWDLGLDTSRVQKLSTSQVLKELDLSELSLLDEKDDPHKPAPRKPGGGFDPYEKARTPGTGPAPVASRPTGKAPDKPRR